jgi:hypothetical protein
MADQRFGRGCFSFIVRALSRAPRMIERQLWQNLFLLPSFATKESDRRKHPAQNSRPRSSAISSSYLWINDAPSAVRGHRGRRHRQPDQPTICAQGGGRLTPDRISARRVFAPLPSATTPKGLRATNEREIAALALGQIGTDAASPIPEVLSAAAGERPARRHSENESRNPCIGGRTLLTQSRFHKSRAAAHLRCKAKPRCEASAIRRPQHQVRCARRTLRTSRLPAPAVRPRGRRPWASES